MVQRFLYALVYSSAVSAEVSALYITCTQVRIKIAGPLHLVVVLLRLQEPPHVTQQSAPVVVASGQVLAELESGGEVGRQLLLDALGLVVGLLRVLKPPRVTQQSAPVEVAIGQL